VPHLPVQGDPLTQRHDLSVDPRPDEPLFEQLLEQVLVFAFLLADQRRQEVAFRAGRQGGDPGHDLLLGLGGDRPSALRAVPLPHAGIKHAEVIIDFRDRAHGRTGVRPRRLLADRDRRRQPADLVDVRLGHLAQEVPGVAGKAFHIPPLPFRIQRVEGQRAFAAAADARQADELIPRQDDRDVAEVMLPRALNHDVRARHV